MNHELAINVKRLPGDLAMWFFILAELTVFAILFIGFAISEQLNPEMFAQGKSHLHQISGLVNTLTLITSSYFVALALTKMHQGNGKQAARLLFVAKLVACIYIAVKIWEYLSLFEQNIGIETNTFFTLYFMITFFHLMQVLLGMVILFFVSLKAAKNEYNSDNISGFESGASYWHMVDLLWIILFPLIYVI
jgi:nitric oxide reductase NorE protein